MRRALVLLVLLGCKKAPRAGGEPAHPAHHDGGAAAADPLRPAEPCFALAECGDACEAGKAAACIRAAEFHAKGWGVSVDRRRQKELLTRACDLGDGDGCALEVYAFLEPSEQGMTALMQRAVRAYHEGCDAGGMEPCETLARLPWQQGGPADPVTSEAVEQKACDLGSWIACSARRGRLERRDPAGAKMAWTEYQEKARLGCEQGRAGACMNLVLYVHPPDAAALKARAHDLAQRGCELGYPPDCDAARRN
jgi:TPR repeat protein